MSGHTAGPWEVQRFATYAEPGAWAVYANDAPEGARMPAVCYGPDAKANAKLIAASPLLADALAGMLADVEAWRANPGGHSPTSKIAAARNALRAAGRLP